MSRALLAMAALAACSLPARGQDAAGALAAWEADDWGERDRASGRVADGWERWTDADLDRFETAGREHPDAEVRRRAREALRTIRTRRALGRALVELGLEHGLDLERPETAWSALGSAVDAW